LAVSSINGHVTRTIFSWYLGARQKRQRQKERKRERDGDREGDKETGRDLRTSEID